VTLVVQCVVQRTAPQGSPRKPVTCNAATTPGLIVRILNSVFFKLLNYSVTLTPNLPMTTIVPQPFNIIK